MSEHKGSIRVQGFKGKAYVPEDDSPARRDAPPSPPPPPEGLPEEIVKAIEAFQISTKALAMGCSNPGHVRRVKATLNTTILHHLSAARAERDQAQRSLNACIADMERGGTCKRVYSDVALGHALEAVEAALSAARARAERAEKALKAALAIGYHIQLNADPYISRCASDANEKIRAALSSVVEEA